MTEKASKARAGALGGRAPAARLPAAHYATIGKKGGQTTARRHGSAYYAKIGRVGGLRVRDLCAQARAAETGKE